MWNDSYRDYVKQLVLTNKGEYPYYVAHTITNISAGGSYNNPTFKVYLSKEPIKANGPYSFVLPSDSVCYSVIGSNSNSNYHNKRVTATTANGTITIDNYEFIYTNAEFESYSVHPDVLLTDSVSQTHFDGFGVAILIVLLGTVVARMLKG